MVATKNIKPADKLFMSQREKLTAISYRMLGSMSDAEDMVQDAYLRWSAHWRRQDRASVDNPAGFLTSLITRLCLDRLRHRRVERANYVGPWLPEPLPTDSGPAQQMEILQSINTAFLMLLDALSPKERAAFTLREAFDYSHADVASLLGISLAHSRQLLHRAHRTLNQKSLLETEPAGRSIEPIVEAFYLAATESDIAKLANLLCDDVIAFTDGGGQVSAALIPLKGIERVSRVLSHLIKSIDGDLSWEWREVNHQRGLLLSQNGELNNVATFDMHGGKIHRIYIMRNPKKLGAFITNPLG